MIVRHAVRRIVVVALVMSCASVAAAQSSTPIAGPDASENAALRARVAELEQEVARLRARLDGPQLILDRAAVEQPVTIRGLSLVPSPAAQQWDVTHFKVNSFHTYSAVVGDRLRAHRPQDLIDDRPTRATTTSTPATRP